MFTIKAALIATLMVSSTTTAFFSSSSFKTTTPLTTTSLPSRMALSMMSDTKKRMGKSVVGTTLPNIPNEMEEVSPFFQRTPAGTGMDERSPTNLSDDLKAMEADKISKISKYFRQNSLKMILESNTHGSVDKLHRISLGATVQSILPASLIPGASMVSSLAAGGLFDDWDFDTETM